MSRSQAGGSDTKHRVFSLPNLPPSLSLLKPVLAQVIALVYALELIVNRTLYRVLVFMPPSISRPMALVVDSLGRVFIVLTIILPLALLAMASPVYYTLLYLAALILDYGGVVKLSLALLATALVLVYRDRSRVLEALLLVLMAIHPYIDAPALVYAANLLWLVVPIPAIILRGARLRWLGVSLPLALVLLYGIYRNPYITGQVFIFAMNLVSPWLLPPAIVLYSLSPSPARISLLLTGPLLQLSNQVLVIASTYSYELWGGEGEGHS